MVCDHAKELEIEDVKLCRLVDGDLLEKRLAEDGYWDRLDLLVERYELSDQLFADVHILMKLDQQES